VNVTNCFVSTRLLSVHVYRYVLLRERNMLFTMEHEAKEEFFLFPNPERIDKV